MIYRIEMKQTPTSSWSQLLHTGDKQAAHDSADRAVMGTLKAHAARVVVNGSVTYQVTELTKTEART